MIYGGRWPPTLSTRTRSSPLMTSSRKHLPSRSNRSQPHSEAGREQQHQQQCPQWAAAVSSAGRRLGRRPRRARRPPRLREALEEARRLERARVPRGGLEEPALAPRTPRVLLELAHGTVRPCETPSTSPYFCQPVSSKGLEKLRNVVLGRVLRLRFLLSESSRWVAARRQRRRGPSPRRMRP